MAFCSAATQPPCGYECSVRAVSSKPQSGRTSAQSSHPILPTHRLPQGLLAFPLYPPRVQALTFRQGTPPYGECGFIASFQL